jgi:tetratricopeptide (TPR) repeat protein
MNGLRVSGFLVLSLAASWVEAKETWIEARSEHFSMVTDAGKGTAQDVLEDLEQLRRLIAQSLPSQPLDSPIPVALFVFKNKNSFRSFQPLRDGKPEEWAALFRSTSFKNFVVLQSDGSAEFVRELAFGQYLNLILSYGDVSYPVWLQSGLSLFYGNAYVSKAHGEIGKMHPRHRQELGEFRSLPLQELFAVTYESPYYRDSARRALFDAQAWALVHYLVIGRNPEGAQALGKFIALLAEGQDQTLAFQEAMKMPLAEIEAAVSLYIRKSLSLYWKVELEPLKAKRDLQFSELPQAVSDARLGELLLAVGRLDEARARLSAAVEGAPDLPDAYEGLGFLSAIAGDSKSALSFLEKAVSRGATSPMVHYQYARSLLDEYSGTVSEIPEPVRASAGAALQKTLEADPSNADAARLYGFLRLFGGSAQEGVDVVTKALEKNQGNAYLLFILGQLYARQENYSAARAIYEHLIVRKLDPEMIASVRRQLDWVIAKIGATP